MKSCIKCGAELNKDNTTWYRQKNYIHKCNDCIKTEKREQARNVPNEISSMRARKYLQNLKDNNPKKYTAKQMAGSATKRAKALRLEYNLTTDFILSICFDICPILGIDLKYGGGDKCGNSASIDRIDSSRGYTMDNVHIVSLTANLMKSNATVEDMLAFADWVKETHAGVRTIEKLNGRAK